MKYGRVDWFELELRTWARLWNFGDQGYFSNFWLFRDIFVLLIFYVTLNNYEYQKWNLIWEISLDNCQSGLLHLKGYFRNSRFISILFSIFLKKMRERNFIYQTKTFILYYISLCFNQNPKIFSLLFSC